MPHTDPDWYRAVSIGRGATLHAMNPMKHPSSQQKSKLAEGKGLLNIKFSGFMSSAMETNSGAGQVLHCYRKVTTVHCSFACIWARSVMPSILRVTALQCLQAGRINPPNKSSQNGLQVRISTYSASHCQPYNIEHFMYPGREAADLHLKLCALSMCRSATEASNSCSLPGQSNARCTPLWCCTPAITGHHPTRASAVYAVHAVHAVHAVFSLCELLPSPWGASDCF